MTYGPEEWGDDDFDTWYTDTIGRRVRDRLDLLRASWVLEIGCASGRMTRILTDTRMRKDRFVLGSDRSEAMVERARARFAESTLARFTTWDLDRIAREERQFDAVVCTQVLHEIDSAQYVLSWARQMLRPMGRILVTVPSASSVHHQLSREPHLSERAERFGVRTIGSPRLWHDTLITGTDLRVVERDEMMAKPYPNAKMQCLNPEMLDHFAKYRGPGGAIIYFELEAAI